LLTELHFLRPMWALALIPLALLIYGLSRQSGRANYWQAVCDPHLLAHLSHVLGQGSRRWGLWAIALCGSLCIFILAGPSWQRLSQVAYQKQFGQVVVVDLSAAMMAKDLKPNRLSRAKFVLRDFLAKHKEGQLGLVVFSGDAFLVSPLTDDPKTIDAMVSELSPGIMPVGGSDIAAGLNMAGKIIQQAGFQGGKVLLLTGSEANHRDIEAARTLAAKGIDTSVLAFATALGAPISDESGFVRDRGKTSLSRLDEQGLKALAAAGDGRYRQFTSSDDVLSGLMAPNVSTRVKKKDKIQLLAWRDQGRSFIFLLLPFALLAFRRGWLESIL